MDVAEELYRLCPDTKIIYVTGYVERFSQQIFLRYANLSGFLTKPVDLELLRANLQKVVDDFPFHETPSLVLRQEGLPISIPLREIFYIESHGHRIHVHGIEETVASYEKLGTIMRSLPAGFIQCHRGYILNLGQVRRFRDAGVILKNGKWIPVSRARYAKVKEAYFAYMGEKL